jgi:glycosyltransferase involved in cell wall biosynthesis
MKEKRLRVLWNSNAMWATSGYAQQSAELLPLMRDEGYPIASVNYFGQQGGKFTLEGILQYPTVNHVYGSDAMVLHGRDFKADVCFSFQDQWTLNPQDIQQINRWIPVTPIDCDPVPENVLQNIRMAYRVITYSKFGQRKLQEKGLFSTYIPHTVNTEIFKPMDKVERKKKAGINPDTFLVGMVSANKEWGARKSFQEVLDAFKRFIEFEPKALIYIHSNPNFPGGFPFDKYAEFIGIRDRLLFPDMYQMNFNTGKEEMALIYNTFDVLMAPSRSEGFCLPLIEAQACGIPVITNNWTSMTELVQEDKTGFMTELADKEWQPNGSYMASPTVDSIYDCLVKIHKKNRVEMGHAARKFIVDNYDTKTVFKESWIPFLEKIEQEVYGKLDDTKKKDDNKKEDK